MPRVYLLLVRKVSSFKLLSNGVSPWYQTLSMIEARRMAAKFPALYRTPMPLADSSVSPAPRERLSYLGYDFEVPWEGIDEAKTKTWKNRVVIAFSSGNALSVAAVGPHDFIDGIASGFHVTNESLRSAFGDAVQSAYEFKELILKATPNRITLHTPWRQCNEMLLMFKGVMLRSPDTDLYQFETQDFRGFQFGDPRRRPRTIGVELYSDSGMLEFYFGQRSAGATPAITQGDINRVIYSIRKSVLPTVNRDWRLSSR